MFGTKLSAATNNAVVAFEADEIDPATRSGWSAAVIGVAAEVTSPAELRRARNLRLTRAPAAQGNITGGEQERVRDRSGTPS